MSSPEKLLQNPILILNKFMHFQKKQRVPNKQVPRTSACLQYEYDIGIGLLLALWAGSLILSNAMSSFKLFLSYDDLIENKMKLKNNR